MERHRLCLMIRLFVQIQLHTLPDICDNFLQSHQLFLITIQLLLENLAQFSRKMRIRNSLLKDFIQYLFVSFSVNLIDLYRWVKILICLPR